MAIRKTNQAADKGQDKAAKGKGAGKPPKAAKPPEATILDDDPEPDLEPLVSGEDSSPDEDYDDPELDAPLPPAAELPPSKRAGAKSPSGKYKTLVTIRCGEDIHKAGQVISLSPEVAAEYLKMGAIRAA